MPDGPDAVEIGCTWYAERVQRTGLGGDLESVQMPADPVRVLLTAKNGDHALRRFGVDELPFVQ